MKLKSFIVGLFLLFVYCTKGQRLNFLDTSVEQTIRDVSERQSKDDNAPSLGKVAWVRFLVSVNHTWDKCLATEATRPLQPNKKWNQTAAISVGDCDQGPLIYDVQMQGKVPVIFLTFYSSVIEDASPPTCQIPLKDGIYKLPTEQSENNQILNGCFIMDSREGYHMTYYWFYVLDMAYG